LGINSDLQTSALKSSGGNACGRTVLHLIPSQRAKCIICGVTSKIWLLMIFITIVSSSVSYCSLTVPVHSMIFTVHI